MKKGDYIKWYCGAKLIRGSEIIHVCGDGWYLIQYDMGWLPKDNHEINTPNHRSIRSQVKEDSRYYWVFFNIHEPTLDKRTLVKKRLQ